MSGTWWRTPWLNTTSKLSSGQGISRAEPWTSRSLVETVQPQPRCDAVHRFTSQVETGPPGAAADELFGLRALPEPDLEHLLAAPVGQVQAVRDVRLPVVAPRVVGAEEALVIVVVPTLQPADDVVAAGVRVPELLHLFLVHGSSSVVQFVHLVDGSISVVHSDAG